VSIARAVKIAAAAAVLLVVVLLTGCGPRKPPVLLPLREAETRTPVIVLPGITGSQLRDRRTGQVIWGNGKSFFAPRDRGYRLARALDADLDDEQIEAFSPILQVKLLGMKFDIYGSLVRALEANGYRLGDLNDPRPGDTLFLFPYDWRYGNIRAAQALGARLEQLRQARGEDVLHVDMICQSNAARIARYAIKYGTASLEQAEAGTARPLESIEIDKLILVGAANGGSIRTMRDLQDGRRYVPLFGRRFRPEGLFGYWALYESLPAYRDDLFFDREEEIVDVDLFDARNWPRYGWGIYRKKTLKRIEESGREDLFGTAEDRLKFLGEALQRARRLHRVLRNDSGEIETRFYMIQNDLVPTAARAQLIERKDGFRTRLESGDAGSPGDGHATLASQMWLSPGELAALARPPVNVPEKHRKIIGNPAAHRWVLEFLAD